MPTVIDIEPDARCRRAVRHRLPRDTGSIGDRVGVADERRERGRVRHRLLERLQLGVEGRRVRRLDAPGRAATGTARAGPCWFVGVGVNLRRLRAIGLRSIVYHRATTSTPARMPTIMFLVFIVPPSRTCSADRSALRASAPRSPVNVTPPPPLAFDRHLLRRRDVDVRRSAAPCPSRRSNSRASDSPSRCPGT